MLDYFYGDQSELFSFFRIPRSLFTDERFKNLSCEAKVLYGLLLDRMGLSQKNGWVDDENRVYVFFRVEEIAESLGCCREKAGKLLNELVGKNGAGLLERKRRGQGKPDMLYVKNFVEKGTSTSSITDMATDDIQMSEFPTSETIEDTMASALEQEQSPSDGADAQPKVVPQDSIEHVDADLPLLSAGNAEDDTGLNGEKHDTSAKQVSVCPFQMSEKTTSRSRFFSHLDVGNSDTNYTKSNNTELNYLRVPSESHPSNRIQSDRERLKKKNMRGETRSHHIPDYDITVAYIKEQIEYDILVGEYGDSGVLAELVALMADVLSSTKPTWRVACEDRPTKLVQERMRQLTSLHIQYVMSCFLANSTEIRNIRQYLVTALFNAPVTIECYYAAKHNVW